MKLKIDLTDPRHVAAAAAFFNSLAGVVLGVNLAIEPEAKPAKSARRATRVKKEDPTFGEELSEQGKNATGAELKEGQAVVVNNEGEIAPAAEREATLEILQDLVPKLTKVSKHINLQASKNNTKVLRDKMLGLGAARVSSMTSDTYQEFYNFIQKEFGETLEAIDNAGA